MFFFLVCFVFCSLLWKRPEKSVLSPWCQWELEALKISGVYKAVLLSCRLAFTGELMLEPGAPQVCGHFSFPISIPYSTVASGEFSWAKSAENVSLHGVGSSSRRDITSDACNQNKTKRTNCTFVFGKRKQKHDIFSVLIKSV